MRGDYYQNVILPKNPDWQRTVNRDWDNDGRNDIVIHDPLKKVEHVYFVVNEPENCKYSPYYVEPENMDGIQKEDPYDEDIEEWTGDLEGAEEENTLQ